MSSPVSWRRYQVFLAALLGAVFVIQGVAALRHMASTGDETHYLGVGCYLLKTQRWDLDDALLHPPLAYYLESLLLVRQPLDYSLFKLSDANERGRRLLASAGDDRLLILSRSAVLLLATLLGGLVLVWGWRYGPLVGLWALFLYAFSPAILSNATLITPDLCLAFFSTLTFYLLWRFINRPSNMTLTGIGVALGLTLLSKYSGVLVAASLVLMAVVLALRRRKTGESPVLGMRSVGFILLVEVLVVNAGYFFTDILPWLDGTAFKSRLFQYIAGTGLFRWIPFALCATCAFDAIQEKPRCTSHEILRR